jgi:hypothetical protein
LSVDAAMGIPTESNPRMLLSISPTIRAGLTICCTAAALAGCATPPVEVVSRSVVAAGRVQKIAIAPNGAWIAWSSDKGELLSIPLGPAPGAVTGRRMAGDVSFFQLGADGTLAFVSGGTVFLARPPSAAVRTSLRTVRSLQFAGGESSPVVLVAHTEGDGALWALHRDGRTSTIAKGIDTYSVAPDGMSIAAVASSRDRELRILPLGRGGRERTVDHRVSYVEFAPASGAFAYLSREGHGCRTLVSVQPDGSTARFGCAHAFAWSPDGRKIGFLRWEADGHASDLYLADVSGSTPPRLVDSGVVQVAFSRSDGAVWFRGACWNEACNLSAFRTDADGGSSGPYKKAGLSVSFVASPYEPGVAAALIQSAPGVNELSVVGKFGVEIDRGVPDLGYAFVPGRRTRVVYAVTTPGREGLYLAELSR